MRFAFRYEDVVSDATEALRCDPKYIKVRFHRAEKARESVCVSVSACV